MQIMIIGAGEVGYNIAEILAKENKDVIVIDSSETNLKKVRDYLDIKTLCGSGSSPQILLDAGLKQTDMLIAVTDSDEVNMVACLIADSQSKVPVKIARIRNVEYSERTNVLDKEHLDIDLAISPEKAASRVILKVMEVPHASSVSDFLAGKVKLFSLKIKQGSPLIGKTLKELDFLHPDEKVLIPAIYRNGSTIIPRGNELIFEGDEVYAITETEKVDKIVSLFGYKTEKIKRVMIAGGGNIGLYLAQSLEERGLYVKVVEKDENRCEYLAEKLNKTVVLHGSISDEELLREENVSDMDCFIAVTNDDKTNIISSLLAKQFGPKKIVTLVNKASYLSLVSTMGIDVAVSPRLTTVSAILQHVRKGKVLSVTSIHEEDAEAIEVVALETSDIVNKPLKDIKEPKGAIIGAIEREGKVIIPNGETIILPGDTVLIFTLHSCVAEVEKSLMVKMEFF